MTGSDGKTLVEKYIDPVVRAYIRLHYYYVMKKYKIKYNTCAEKIIGYITFQLCGERIHDVILQLCGEKIVKYITLQSSLFFLLLLH